MGLEAVRIVLVEPAGARNLGSVARVMKNMGLWHLILVNPQCEVRSQEARQMAVHAQDVLDAAIVVADLPSALVGCHRVAATVGREEMRVESLRSVLPWLLPAATVQSSESLHDPSVPFEVQQGIQTVIQSAIQSAIQSVIQTAIVFGREDHGLSNAELKYAQRCITIPSSPDYPSLNLAQAVGICCYELSQQAQLLQNQERHLSNQPNDQLDDRPSLFSANSPDRADPSIQNTAIQNNLSQNTLTQNSLTQNSWRSDAAPFQLTHAFYLGLEALLLTIGYLHDHTAESRMKKFRALLDRAVPTAQEMTMLLGILRQAKWAIGQDAASRVHLDPHLDSQPDLHLDPTAFVKGKPTETSSETV